MTLRDVVDPGDLYWEAPAAAEPAPSDAQGLRDVLDSLEQVRERCRRVSTRVHASARPTVPAFAGSSRARPCGMRAPEAGPTDVVTLRPGPRAPTSGERAPNGARRLGG